MENGDRRIRGAIDFENVSFRYGSRRWVLRDVFLHIDAGECVGIAGESGSGKTTLVSLLARFFEACDGSISIDGIDVRDYSLECLRREIAFVPQEIVLFNTSIAENIRIGRPSATADEMYEVARAARVDEIVGRHPLGFETMVGERGLALSEASGGNGLRLLAPYFKIPRFWCSMSQRATSMRRPKTQLKTCSIDGVDGEQPSSYLTVLCKWIELFTSQPAHRH